MQVLRIFYLAMSLLMPASYAQQVFNNRDHAQWLEQEPTLVARWQASLPQQAKGMGPACADRAAWGTPAIEQRAQALLKKAQDIIKSPFPAWSDTDYLAYSTRGIRPEGERMMNARRNWLHPVVIAECLTWQGTFLPYIEKGLRELAAQKSWVWPAHDRDLAVFEQKKMAVDLGAANMAHEIAQALYMLGDKLPADLRALLEQELKRRIFEPVYQSASLAREPRQSARGNTWLWAEHNWNSVCLKGITGAAMAALTSRQERAKFAALAQFHSRYYLAGFPGDGYSTEGSSYWNYGFGHFLVLREILMLNSANRIDMLTGDIGLGSEAALAKKIANVALYPARIQMQAGNIAAFGDAGIRQRPESLATAYLAQAMPHMPIGAATPWAQLPVNATPITPWAPLPETVHVLFASPAPMAEAVAASYSMAKPSPESVFSDFFADAGVLVSRAAPVASAVQSQLAISIKAGGIGGGNGNHSHDDIGSSTIGLADQQPLGDVGMPRYSAKTFSKERRMIRSINSWGHPVPLVAGRMQREAIKIKAPVLDIQRSALRDEILMDLRDAYEVSSLQSLTRRMTHERGSKDGKAAQRIVIEDQMKAQQPITFESALTTLGGIAPDALQKNSYVFTSAALVGREQVQKLRVTVQSDAAWEWIQETVDEEGIRFTRAAVRLLAPTAQAQVSFVITPLP
jgi:hypothetical protein